MIPDRRKRTLLEVACALAKSGVRTSVCGTDAIDVPTLCDEPGFSDSAERVLVG